MTSKDLINSVIELQKQYENNLPPVDSWSPELSGDIDIRIDREGRWFHEGDPIERRTLVTLFSSILKREGDDHFLVTPVEKWRIKVDVAPFLITALRVEGEPPSQALIFETNVGNEVLLSAANPLRMVMSGAGESLPIVMVRNGLEALLSRSVFYEMANNWAQNDEERYFVESAGEYFWLND
ncbi:MAG: hypothetical protein CL693_16970 [Cellvibrionaceae bacterium]|nr:hypothetical protein [Cellvibrionaceae bacterium]|tara:strand:+ start:93 stop:638 length:546 start_codon:yes stop_codon:yes gene_type:complete